MKIGGIKGKFSGKKSSGAKATPSLLVDPFPGGIPSSHALDDPNSGSGLNSKYASLIGGGGGGDGRAAGVQTIQALLRSIGNGGGEEDTGYGSDGSNPVLEALNGILSSLPEPPSRDQYLAPFSQAESATRAAHDAALPAIAQIYSDLRTKLGATHQDALSTINQQVAGSQAQMAQTQQGVSSLQNQAIQDLQTQGGGQPALGSLTAGAQAQAGANEASLKIQSDQALQRQGEMQRALEAQQADRQSSAATGEASARSHANSALQQILGQIGLQRTKAEGQYNELVNDSAQRRAGLQLEIAKASMPDEGKYVDPLDRALKEATLQEKVFGLKEKEKKSATSTADFLNPKNYGDLAATNPVSFEFFRNLASSTDGLGEALEAVDEWVAKDDEDVAAGKVKDSKGRTVKKAGFIRYQGKAISPDVIKSWLRRFDELNRV